MFIHTALGTNGKGQLKLSGQYVSQDRTALTNTIKQWKHWINEYEAIKAHHHPTIRFVSDFYRAIGIKRQNFNKYYHRYKELRSDEAFIPRKRGAKYRTRRRLPFIEHKVEDLRIKGLSRFDIYYEMLPRYKRFTPSPSAIYNICKRAGLNRLTPEQIRSKRMIIKQRAGELGHIDCHYLPLNTVPNIKKLYLVGCVDDYSRIAWVAVTPTIKSLDVMFATQEILSVMKGHYGITFEGVLTDNGSEFRSNRKDTHPFERMLDILSIKHSYTRPNRPQTNGKIERFWRTINDELIDGTDFDDIEEFNNELQQYLIYYNEARPHMSLKGVTPKRFLEDHLKEATDEPNA